MNWYLYSWIDVYFYSWHDGYFILPCYLLTWAVSRQFIFMVVIILSYFGVMLGSVRAFRLACVKLRSRGGWHCKYPPGNIPLRLGVESEATCPSEHRMEKCRIRGPELWQLCLRRRGSITEEIALPMYLLYCVIVVVRISDRTPYMTAPPQTL